MTQRKDLRDASKTEIDRVAILTESGEHDLTIISIEENEDWYTCLIWLFGCNAAGKNERSCSEIAF